MCENFTEHDFNLLMEFLKPFDDTFPKLQEHFDRLYFQLTENMNEINDCEIYASFDEFRGLANKARKCRTVVPEQNMCKLTLLCLTVSKILVKIPYRFPHLAEQTIRVIWEVANAVAPMEKTFEEFSAETETVRAAYSSKVKGVG